MKFLYFSFFLMLSLNFFQQDAWSSHEFGFGVDSSVYANRKIMANPPLPMNKLSKGTYKLSVQPALITGEMDSDGDGGGGGGASNEMSEGEFEGYGGSIGYSYALTDKWGLFAIGMGSKVEGDFSYRGCSNTGGGCIDTVMSGAKVSSISLAVGGMYKFEKWATSLFAGPFVNKTTFSQSVRQTTNNVRNADFDMSGEKTGLGVLVGVQGDYQPFENFKFNPYLLIGFKISEDCGPYQVDQVRLADTSGRFLEHQSSPDCGGSGGTTTRQDRKFSYNHSFQSVGVNMVYVPWDLSVNLIAPFFDAFKSDEDPKVTLLTFSLSFGDFVR